MLAQLRAARADNSLDRKAASLHLSRSPGGR
jgi:hypothetical protein